MFEFFLYLHLTALSFWIGITIAAMLLLMRKQMTNHVVKGLGLLIGLLFVLPVVFMAAFKFN